MAQSLSFTAAVNPNRVTTKFLEYVQVETEFANLTGENYGKTFGVHMKDSATLDTPRGNKAMILEYRDTTAGGTDIKIPVIQLANDLPLIGMTDATNAGTSDRIMYLSAQVALMTFPFAYLTGLEAQKIQGNELLAKVNDAVTSTAEKATQYIDKELFHTVYNGVCAAMTPMSGWAGTRVNTTPLIPHSHGNFFVPGVGIVGISGGRPLVAGYEASVKAALDGISATDGYKLSPAMIEDIEGEAVRKRIKPLRTKFGDRYLLICSPSQVKQFKQSVQHRVSSDSAWQGHGWEAQSFRNFEAVWSRSILVSSLNTFGVQQTSTTSLGNCAVQTSYNNIPKYGASTVYSVRTVEDENEIKLGILCGEGMITKAIGRDPVSVTEEEFPGALTKKLYLRMMFAYVLSDIVDLDGSTGLTAGQWDSNQSSLVFATWSPNYGV